MRHPLHPALVHFPIACWSLAVVSDFASPWVGEAAWRWSAILLAIGCTMALAAMMAGLMELSRIPDGPALRDTYWHMGIMLTAFILFTARLLTGLDQLQALAPGWLALLLDATGFIALAIGGWLGGRLVYGHGIGR
ncbi:DUF2231 domain-containing protein [Castellaniella sp.]|uniref:DUF2231 domain-containing protein n=1 Tax=Castellaniella sp. TaxID=1955812 RepID=UPI002AFE47AF|nr:DUF2231 domain-containing protein [Castellaniella sp.]